MLGLGLTSRAALQGAKQLLYDDFRGSEAPLSGRLPVIGSAWSTTGASGAAMVAGDGRMWQQSGGPAGYGTQALARRPVEIGCTFELSEVHVGVTLGGSVTVGDLLAIQILPSGAETHTQVNYFVAAGDGDLTDAAASWAAAIAADPTLAAAGVAATAVGTTIEIIADVSPRVVAKAALAAPSFNTPSSITLSEHSSDAPTLACYQTGADFVADGMVHFRLGPDGFMDWTIFDDYPRPLDPEPERVTRGLRPEVEYTYRCRLDPPHVHGSIVDPDGVTLSTITAIDDRIASYAGAVVFFETGHANTVTYRSVWAR